MAFRGFLVVFMLVAIAAPVLATDYIVGDDDGWRLNVNYTAWAEGKQFYIGDRLIFNYGQGAHNVYRVNGTLFQQCGIPSIAPLTSGNDIITLAMPAGRKWYICGVGQHCANGMKLAITVSPAMAPTPAPSPASSVSGSSQKSPFSVGGFILAMLSALMMIVV